MKDRPEVRDRLELYLTQLELGTLPADRNAEFNALLADDEAARQYVADYLTTVALIDWSMSRGEETVVSPTAEGGTSLWRRCGENAYDFVSHYITLSVIVSALVIANGLLLMAIIVPGANHDKPGVETPSTEFVARISESQQATFDATSDGNFQNRDLFNDDTIVLNGGLVVVEYDTGAQVVLEGPCRYSVSGRNSGELKVGKSVATVPPSAVGFTVRTELADFVDLGTEFGVEIQQDQALLAVFDGAVEVHPLGSPNASTPILIEAGAGLRLVRNTVGGVDVSPENATQGKFVRRLLSQQEKLAQAKPGDLLFADSFDISAASSSVNRSSSDMPDRQRGIVAPLLYRSLGESRIENDVETGSRLLLGMPDSIGSHAVGLLHNFADQAIADAGGLVIEFDLDPVTTSVGESHNWAAIVLFDDYDQQLEGKTPLVTGRTALLLRDSGLCELFDAGGKAVSSQPWGDAGRQLHHVRLEVAIRRFDGKTPATIRAYADGAAEPFIDYTTKAGFTVNYLMLEARNQPSAFDNLKISLLDTNKSKP